MKSPRYRFGAYRLDVATRELWRANERIPLAAKAFECLAYLIEHRERAVGRDELVAAVWGRVDAGDNLLTQAIWRARRAIGDAGDGENALRTVPRFGYRWAAPVQAECGDAGENAHAASAGGAMDARADSAAPVIAEGDDTAAPGYSADTQPHPQPASALPPATQIATVAAQTDMARGADAARDAKPKPPRRPRLFALAAALIVAAAGTVALVQHLRTHDSAASDAAASVVVLPVGVADAKTDTVWLRFGAMDYVASRLRDAHLGVMPSERVVALAGPAQPAGPDSAERDRLLHTTGAGYLLVPRARQTDGRWQFAIDAYHAQSARSYRAEAATPLQAADDAAAAFLADLGRAPAVAATPGATDELVQRIDAASLAGNLVEARRELDSADAAQRADPRLALRRARLAFRSGQLEEAEAAFAPLADTQSSLPASIRASAQLGLGGIAVRRRRYDVAEPFYTAAIATLGERGDATLLGRAYNERAIVNGGLGRLDLAIADMGRAHVALERSGDPIGSAYSDINGALIAAQRGRYADAIGIFDRAIGAFDRFGIADGLATALANKANTQLGELDAGGAVESTARAWRLLPAVEDRRLIEFVAQNHIRALRSNGRLAEAGRALDRFDGADAGAAASTDPAFATLRAALLVDQGKGALALQLGEEILERIKHAPAGSCSDTIPEAALVLTEAALQSKRADAARPLLGRLGEFVDSPQDPDWAFASELARGLVLAADGDADADRHFAAALALADSQAQPEAIITAAAPYADYLAEHADRARAVSLLAHVQPYAERDYRAARAAAELHLLLDERDPALKAQGRARALAGERIAGGP